MMSVREEDTDEQMVAGKEIFVASGYAPGYAFQGRGKAARIPAACADEGHAVRSRDT